MPDWTIDQVVAHMVAQGADRIVPSTIAITIGISEAHAFARLVWLAADVRLTLAFDIICPHCAALAKTEVPPADCVHAFPRPTCQQAIPITPHALYPIFLVTPASRAHFLP